MREIYRVTLGLCAAIMAAGTVLCLALPDQLMGLFTQNPETVRAGAEALRIISAGFLVSSVSVAAGGALEGLGKGGPSLVISLLRYTLVMIPTAWLLSCLMGPTGVWHAFWISEAVTALLSILIYRRSRPVTHKAAGPKAGGLVGLSSAPFFPLKSGARTAKKPRLSRVNSFR